LRAVEPDERYVELDELLRQAVADSEDADPAEVIAAVALVVASLVADEAAGRRAAERGRLTAASAERLRPLAARALEACVPAWYWDSWVSLEDRAEAREAVERLAASLASTASGAAVPRRLVESGE